TAGPLVEHCQPGGGALPFGWSNPSHSLAERCLPGDGAPPASRWSAAVLRSRAVLGGGWYALVLVPRLSSPVPRAHLRARARARARSSSFVDRLLVLAPRHSSIDSSSSLLVIRRWTMDDGRWIEHEHEGTGTMDDGRWTMDDGRWNEHEHEHEHEH